MLEQIWIWGQEYWISLIWSFAVLILYWMVNRFTIPLIERGIDNSRMKSDSAEKAHHTVRLISGFVAAALMLLIWGIDFGGLLILSTSLLTLTGVALFANWSLLSNITSYFVLLFHSSFRRGNHIRVLDGDNYIEGFVSEIGLFNTKLITEEREVIIYPNNLLIVRPTVVNSRVRVRTIGKASDIYKLSEDEQNVELDEFNNIIIKSASEQTASTKVKSVKAKSKAASAKSKRANRKKKPNLDASHD
ncbi:mechanosensitive ion channel family protein [Paraneptunicella aestuarii]|uniref:mechanosensitive ion channel family protein n=1 Tax=Paraneptunicella aestuarii TaxID=2831148 RepID=UPI001E5B2839|nr:mechanosensitive ion channel family protein [Paraneptunicella aestuarii]UAA40164.1 mechanosensitive ion channel family protein [Paraneptunicella aestuarii]